MMSDEQLSFMGVCTIGDRLRMKAVCSPVASASKSRGLSKSSEIQERVEKVKEILNRNKRGKRGGTDKDGSTGCPPKVRQKETLKFEFGWKHWVDGNYKQKRIDKGGGKRRISISRAATYDECLEIAKKLFFPKGVISEGDEDDMYFALGNYDGVQIEEVDGITEFSPAKYKELTGFNLPSLYLPRRMSDLPLSKRK